MLTRVDRLQLAVPDRRAAAAGWVGLLGAEHEGDDRVAALGARRSTYRLGSGRVELLEPDGTGPVATAVAERNGHLYAGGMSTHDLGALVAHLRTRGVEPPVEGDQVHLDADHTGGHGLRLVVSAGDRDGSPSPVGMVDFFYEVTNLVRDAAGATSHYADLLGIDSSAFVPISSDRYGYSGALTLLDPDRLDRLEVITPDKAGSTMHRYFERFGESLYMAFAESGRLSAIAERVAESGAVATIERGDDGPGEHEPNTIFLHPAALGGMMLGLSRRTLAWVWSGHPERVEA